MENDSKTTWSPGVKTIQCNKDIHGDHRVQVASDHIWIKFKKLVVVQLVLLFVFFTSIIHAADVNVLIVGTTTDKSSSLGGDSKPFDVRKVRDELQKILGGAGIGSVQVDLHDFSANGTGGNSLIAEFYLNDSYYTPVAADMWPYLRGESGPDWDYVILVGEPWTIENYPGLYTHGVAEVGKEVAKGGAETVLLMGWPGAGSSSSVDYYKEVVYRTGRTLGYKVAPAGLAWQAQGSTYGTTHPTADGAYIAAASIFSRIWGQSAAVSSYPYNDTLANNVHQTVVNNIGKQHYSGLFTQPKKAFRMLYDQRRYFNIGGVSSSTENGLKDMFKQMANQNGLDMSEPTPESPQPRGINISRDYTTWQNGYAMASRFSHPGNGYYDSADYIYFVDSSVSYNLRSSENSVAHCRHIPSELLWAQFNKEFPEEPLIEFRHGQRHWKRVHGAYWYTMFTGRCAIGPKPTPGTEAYKDYMSARIGYETAWRFARVQGRAPGFKIMPSASLRHAVDPLAPETMKVQFVLPPQKNVTVSIGTDQPWATVSPQTLTFAAGDDQTVQQITVAVSGEASARRGEKFNVTYTTVSDDEVCNGLSESWAYHINSPPIASPQSIERRGHESFEIFLAATDADPKQVISYRIVDEPTYGSLLLTGNVAVYTPNPDFIGVDTFRFVANDGLVDSAPSAEVQITIYPLKQYNFNLLINPSAERTPLSAYGWTGDWGSSNRSGLSFIPPLTGTRVFKSNQSLPLGESYQMVDLSPFADQINAGMQSFRIEGYCIDQAVDDARLQLEFLDANDQVLSMAYQSNRVNSNVWVKVGGTVQAPVGATKARVILQCTRLSGTTTLGWFEDLSLVAIQPTNSAPVATNPPVASVPVATPTSIVLTATDIDGNALTYRIVPGSGPNYGSIVGQDANGMPIYQSNAGYLGPDQFSFVANDGELDSNVAVAQINVRSNESPNIVLNKPTTDHIYMTLTNGILIDSTITDDGSPADPGALTITWSQVSGPVVATFEQPNAEDTAINWGDFNPGDYVFRVTADDGELVTTKDITVTVLNNYAQSQNVAPQVDVGGPYNGNVNEPLTLYGVNYFNDDLPVDPGVTTVEWLQLSGPGTAVFGNASQYVTDVTFDTAGMYVLRLTGDDGEVKVYEDVSITISGTVNASPIANAGPNQSVTDSDGNGSENVTLNGTGSSDSDGTIVSYVWKKGSTQITTGATPTVSLTVGSHTITLTVTDDDGATGTDTVLITVNPAPLVQSPYSGTPSVIPGTIIAGHYDTGGEGIAYHDTTSGFEGSNNFRNDDVDGGETVIGWFADGEWLEYTVDVAAAGSYDLSVKVSSGNSGGTFHVEFNGVDTSGPIIVPGTGSWGTYVDVTVPVTLAAGQQVMRIVKDSGSLNLSDLVFTSNVQTTTVPLVASTNRLGWFTFDSDTSDMDGTLSLSLTGAQVGVADGKFSGAFSAADSGQYGTIADHVQLNTGGPWAARTIAVWFKLDAISGRQVVLEEGGGTRGFNCYVDNGMLRVGGWDKNKDGTDVDTWSGTWLNLGTVAANQWYHVALVLDATVDPTRLSDTAFTGYLNGVAIAAGNGMQIAAHADDGGIGGVVGSTYFHDGATGGNAAFAGKIDDLAIWNRSLSAGEIATLAGGSAPPANTPPTAVAGANQVVTDADGNGSELVTLTGAGSTDSDGTIVSYVWSKGTTQIAIGVSPTVALTVGDHTITLTVTDDDGATATDDVVVSVRAPTTTVPLVASTNRLAWFTFDTNTSDVDGTLSLSLTGAQVGVADGKFNGAFRASAAGQYGTIADHSLLNTGGPWAARTTAVWFKLDAISGRQVVLEEGGSTRGFNIYVDNGTLRVGGWDKNKDGTDVDTWSGTWLNLGSVAAGQWYHVALVLDATADPTHISGTAFTGYLNGVAIASGNGMQISAHADDFGIGAVVGSTLYHDGATNGNAAFAGNVDDLAIWNRPLTPAEIMTLAGGTPASAPDEEIPPFVPPANG